MTLNRGAKLRQLDNKRRGSMPFAAHHHHQQQQLHRRSMPVDERELQQAPLGTAPTAPTTIPSPAPTSGAPRPSDGEALRHQGWDSSSDSVISSSSGSDSDGSLYKVVLLGEHGVGKTSLARIFGGVEDCADADEAGE